MSKFNPGDFLTTTAAMPASAPIACHWPTVRPQMRILSSPDIRSLRGYEMARSTRPDIASPVEVQETAVRADRPGIGGRAALPELRVQLAAKFAFSGVFEQCEFLLAQAAGPI